VKCALLVLDEFGEPSELVTGNGENISTFDVSRFGLVDGSIEPLGVLDVHSHDVTSLAIWKRQRGSDDKADLDPEIWIVSGSLDGTVRKWSLTGLCLVFNLSYTR